MIKIRHSSNSCFVMFCYQNFARVIHVNANLISDCCLSQDLEWQFQHYDSSHFKCKLEKYICMIFE